MEQSFRQDFSPLVPLMAASDPAQRMNFATAAALVWLSAMERHEQLARQGVQSLAIPFHFWKERPRETAVAMLEYAGLRPEDLAAVEAALARDSQAGTAVAQEETHHRHIDPRFLDDPDALDRVLRAHSFIHSADFVAANTLAF